MLFIKSTSIITVVALILLSCGPGLSDYTTRIGFTKYFFTHNDGLNRFIWKQLPDKRVWVVDVRVIKYQYIDDFIIAVRQVSNTYDCDRRMIITELKNEFDYWIIETKTDIVHESLNFNEYNDKITAFGIHEKANLPDEDFLKKTERALPLSDCTNPVKI